ncbi:TPA: hypothetical protein U1352_000661 [Streptococcus suis]|nr:hypothetical protein [Streptococcus suis]HEM5278598.1 hypothetical protein [Streptococcus suis]
MVSIPMKSNPFVEKITSVKLINHETGQFFNTVNNFDFFPGTISLVAVVDFFNVYPNKNYTLSVSVFLDNGANYPVHATRIFIPSEQLIAISNNGLGKATGNFDFNLTIEQPCDFYLFFAFIPEGSSEHSDTFYSYHSFLKR